MTLSEKKARSGSESVRTSSAKGIPPGGRGEVVAVRGTPGAVVASLSTSAGAVAPFAGAGWSGRFGALQAARSAVARRRWRLIVDSRRERRSRGGDSVPSEHGRGHVRLDACPK